MKDRERESVRSLVRTLVLRTNPYFPFRFTNRWPYSWALNAVIAMVRRQPGVRALYLRHGLTSAAWIPGKSDIDLALFVNAGMPLADEFELVRSIQDRYRKLKRYFPMLGELLLLGADDVNLWLRGTCESPDRRDWRLLYGEPVYNPDADRSPDWRRRCLNLALWIYLDLMPPCLAKPPSFLRDEDVRRRHRKIARTLAPVLGDDTAGAPGDEKWRSADLCVAHAAIELERAVTLLDGDCARDTERESPEIAGGCRFDLGPDRRLPGIYSALRFRDAVLLVLPDHSPAEAIAEAMRSTACCGDLPSLPLPERVWRYMIRKYDPYQYREFLRERTVLYGADPLVGVMPATSRDIAAALLAQSDGILTFPRGETMFPPRGMATVDELERGFVRLMGTRLLLEKNWLSPVRHEIYAQAKREYPEAGRTLDEIVAATAHDPDAAQRKAFALFVSLADAVREGFERRIGVFAAPSGVASVSHLRTFEE